MYFLHLTQPFFLRTQFTFGKRIYDILKVLFFLLPIAANIEFHLWKRKIETEQQQHFDVVIWIVANKLKNEKFFPHYYSWQALPMVHLTKQKSSHHHSQFPQIKCSEEKMHKIHSLWKHGRAIWYSTTADYVTLSHFFLLKNASSWQIHEICIDKIDLTMIKYLAPFIYLFFRALIFHFCFCFRFFKSPFCSALWFVCLFPEVFFWLTELLYALNVRF